MRILTTFVLALLISGFAQAQNVTPEVAVGATTDAVIDQHTTAPTLTQGAQGTTNAFPNVEFLVTKKGQAAVDASGAALTGTEAGDVVIYASSHGQIVPRDMNTVGVGLYPSSVTVAVGDTLEMVAIGYDLAAVGALVDKLLGNAACCTLVQSVADGTDVCAILSQNNINSGADVTGLYQVLIVLDAATGAGDQLSVESIEYIMGELNAQAANISTCINTLDYGVSRNVRASYTVKASTVVEQLSTVASFAIFPNPSLDADVNVMINTTKATDLTVNLYSALGQRVQTISTTVNGQTQVSLETSSLNAGMYFVELTDGNNKVTRKLIVR